MPSTRKPVIVAMSGASGSIYAVRLLERLKRLEVPTHLVASKASEITLRYETGFSLRQLRELADTSYQIGDIGAAIASGSFETAGMVVAPCSIRSLAAIAHGLADNLLTRAADVTLKERRKLILMLRETPFNLIHINAMKAVTEAGAIVAPPLPAFYIKPTTIDEIVNHSVARVVDLLGIEGDDDIKRWAGLRNSNE